jgi:hypothetical protein
MFVRGTEGGADIFAMGSMSPVWDIVPKGDMKITASATWYRRIGLVEALSRLVLL